MDCWHCKRSAVGACKFCGRGLCENHVKTHPFILDVFESNGKKQALLVEDALFCGACHPRPEPLELPDLN